VKKFLHITAGILISAFFLWLAFRNSDLSQVLSDIRHADVRLLAAMFALSVIVLALRSYRWKMLGKDYKAVPWINFFKATTMGMMLNTFLPFRTGDLLQGYFLAKNSSLSKSYTLATVFVERILDIALPAFALIIGSSFVILPQEIRISRIVLLVVLMAAGTYLFLRFRGKIIGIAESFGEFAHIGKIKRFIDNTGNALVFLKDKKVAASVVPMTFVLWVISAVGILLVLLSLNIHINFYAIFLIHSIMVLSSVIPAAPGALGTWEFFCVLALGIFNVDRDKALSYAVISHFMAVLPTVCVGLFYFFREVFLKKNLSFDNKLPN
jgi:glycosyltransferase 2 family protein